MDYKILKKKSVKLVKSVASVQIVNDPKSLTDKRVKHKVSECIEDQNIDLIYDKVKILGSGGFADVYEYKRKWDGLKVACKIQHKEDRLTSEKVTVVENEIFVNNLLTGHCKMTHKNIVNMLNVYALPKTTLVFDLCEKGDLFDDIEKQTKYTEEDAAFCMMDILSGLAYCHGKGVYHRDLKPENFLLVKDPERPGKNIIKIADFGLAAVVKSKGDEVTDCKGTENYMSPEVISNQAHNHKADAWSVGVILFILLAGYPPFSDKSEIMAGKILFYREDFQDTSEEARQLICNFIRKNQLKRKSCAKMLTKDPWINGVAMKHNCVHRTETIENIKKFNAKRRFKVAGKAVGAAINLSKKAMGITRESSSVIDNSDKIHEKLDKLDLNSPQEDGET